MTRGAVRGGARPPLAGRYRLEERLSEQDGSSVWKATDEALARRVTLRTFTPGFPRVGEVVAAARAAGRLNDHRLVQIFDADDRPEDPRVVTEWPSGARLGELLRAGPLGPMRAVEIIAEAADALAVAHAAGLAHLCLTPDSLWWSTWGEVKISGLGIAAALTGVQADNPALADTRGLASMLYAALTGYWPGEEKTALPAAPRSGGRAYRPRQLRAGIPRDIDAVTCRALFGEAGSAGPAILDPAQLAEALAAIARPSPQPFRPRSAASEAPTFAEPHGAVQVGAAAAPTRAEPVDLAQTAAAAAPTRAERVDLAQTAAAAAPTRAEPVGPAQTAAAAAAAPRTPAEPVDLVQTAAAAPPTLAGPLGPAQIAAAAAVTPVAPVAPVTASTLITAAATAAPVTPVTPFNPVTPGLPLPQVPGTPRAGPRPPTGAATSGSAGRPARQAPLARMPATVVRALLAAAVILVLAVVAVEGWQIARHVTASRSGAAQARILTPVSAVAFDPYGDSQGENNQLAPLAIDANPGTAWHTDWYTSANFGNLKSGTGLLLDMGKSVTITSARIRLGSTPGASFQVRTGATANSLTDLRPLARATDVGGQVNLRLTSRAHGRYVLIWFTKLPPDTSGSFQVSVYDVRIEGPA